ncbi:putative MFS transporter [Cucumis melo var. makuwa]|uniref:Putative MFS transporter n=1 Tax=Cucumis melo var. makuwa TaxID=1194695 RepID=A0A5D3BQW9_CUCMM|nr:putative MFS transporter [Cucumis melo var. makuwa]
MWTTMSCLIEMTMNIDNEQRDDEQRDDEKRDDEQRDDGQIDDEKCHRRRRLNGSREREGIAIFV